MEVFVLMGGISYEGETLLGVYASEQEANDAENEHSQSRDPFDYYEVRRSVLGAAPRGHW